MRSIGGLLLIVAQGFRFELALLSIAKGKIMLVILSCGGKKAATPQPASLMYKGPYFTVCLRYARFLTSDDHIRILSSKYGLLPLTQEINPYEMRITDKEAISNSDLLNQAVSQGLVDESDVIIVAGVLYATKVLKIWPHAQTPLMGIGKMGKQMKYMNEQVELASDV